VLKSRREYTVFLGRGVRILAAGYPDWIGGILDRVDEECLYLRENGRTHGIRFEDVKKAKLDYSQEVD
jgi:ribosome maturation factor RimP